jgi:hypothetical protein
VYIGAGLNFPTSDYSDEHDAGFLGVGGVSFDLPMEGLSVYGEGFWGRNSFSHDDYGDGAVTNPYGVMGGLLYDFAEEDSPGFYAFGQAGLMVHKFSSDEFEGASASPWTVSDFGSKAVTWAPASMIPRRLSSDSWPGFP